MNLFLKRVLVDCLQRVPRPVLLLTLNSLLQSRRLPTRCHFANGKLQVSEGDIVLNIVHPRRLLLYTRGMRNRIKHLTSTYFLDQMRLQDETGFFVDVGANIGELSLCIPGHLDYVAVEPSPAEFQCLTKNVSGQLLNVGAWYEEEMLTLHIDSGNADSTLIASGREVSTCQVKCIRLDSIPALRQATRISVLKIEAEGAEPEVLKGAEQILFKVKWLVIDTGYERGPDQVSTTEDCISLAIQHGFTVTNINAGRLVLLMENKELT